MLGRILAFSVQNNEGVITSEDGGRYIFSGAEWRHDTPPVKGQRVDFDLNDTGKAIQVFAALGQEHGSDVPTDVQNAASHLWVAILSLFMAIFTSFMLLDDQPWDEDTKLGYMIFCIAGLAAGIVTLANRFSGQGLAIAGVIINGITLMAAIGLLLG